MIEGFITSEEDKEKQVDAYLFKRKIFKYAVDKGLSYQMAGIFARSFYMRFGINDNRIYWYKWISRFQKGFENLWADLDTESRYFLSKAMFEIIVGNNELE